MVKEFLHVSVCMSRPQQFMYVEHKPFRHLHSRLVAVSGPRSARAAKEHPPGSLEQRGHCQDDCDGCGGLLGLRVY